MHLSNRVCPIAGCEERVPNLCLMCLFHWQRVSLKTKLLVRSGLLVFDAGAGSAPYREARALAIKEATR
jgi:hypothetical protein